MVPCLTLIFLTAYTKTFHSEKTVRQGGKSAAAALDGDWRQKLQARNATMRELHSQGGTVGIVATPQDFPRPAAATRRRALCAIWQTVKIGSKSDNPSRPFQRAARPPAPLSCGPVGATSLGNGVLWDGNSVPWDGNGVPWELVGETSHEKVTNSGKNSPPRDAGGRSPHATASQPATSHFCANAGDAPPGRK